MIDHTEKYQKLAEKYDLPIEVIQKICDSQFEFAKNIISEGKDEQVQLQFLGKFLVKPNRRRLVKERQERIRKINAERKKGRSEE
jgi:hypothetical protein